ncbi:hypothetical protein, partial [Escherichia coli]|uniref:hypothetical protein n=1 Tax=Escherichia coli TaxID=562 RepID=UPI003F243AD5
MAFLSKLLTEGERVVVSTRTHPKALLGPMLVLLVTALATAVVAGMAVRELDGAVETVAGAVTGALAAA